MNVAIIMATMRWQNWAIVFEHAAAAQRPEARFYWFPVVYEREVNSATPEARNILFGFDTPQWIKPVVISEEPGVNHCMRKQNAALDVLEGNNFDGWIGAYADDNVIPRNVGCHLARAARSFPLSLTGGEGRGEGAAGAVATPRVIVFSHKRGQHIPAEDPKLRYGTHDLIAAPGHMRVGYVSGEQYFVHSDLMRGWRWPHHSCADGMLIEHLWGKYPDQFRFVPDYYTTFNALEPGRWEPDELKKVIEAE